MKRPGLVGVIFLGILTAAGTESHALEAVFPATLEVRSVWRTDQLPEGVGPEEASFALDHEGRPHLGFRDILVALGHREDVDRQVFHVPGVQTVDAFAWMRDGVLMVISGNELGVPGEKGLDVILTLPAPGMKIESASGDRLYLYGGDTAPRRQSLYMYRKGGQLLHLLKAPAAIGAVAGDGVVTFFAVANSIYLQVAGEPLIFVYEAEAPVTSLAVAPPLGLFYGTERIFGYVTESGKGYAFVQGAGGELRVHGEDLYLFVPEEGVVKAAPVSSFEALAQSLAASLPEHEEEATAEAEAEAEARERAEAGAPDPGAEDPGAGSAGSAWDGRWAGKVTKTAGDPRCPTSFKLRIAVADGAASGSSEVRGTTSAFSGTVDGRGRLEGEMAGSYGAMFAPTTVTAKFAVIS